VGAGATVRLPGVLLWPVQRPQLHRPTPIAVCHNRDISQHKVFDGLAVRGRNSAAWFFGFKLDLMVNVIAGLIAYCHQPKKPSLYLAQHLMLEAIA
jgi:hypothetical protein